MSNQIKLEEFLKDKLDMKFYISNQVHQLTTAQIRMLLIEFVTLHQSVQHDKESNSNQPLQLKGIKRSSEEDATGEPER
jgi:hypothetical protein